MACLENFSLEVATTQKDMTLKKTRKDRESHQHEYKIEVIYAKGSSIIVVKFLSS